MSTPGLLTAFETCPRKGLYASKFEARRLQAVEMVRFALKSSLTAPCDDSKPFGETAGDTVMQLAADRGLDTDLHDLYAPVVHHACLADIMVSCIRKSGDKPWIIPPPVQNWTSACFLSPEGGHLRRIVLVSHWTDERAESEKRSWFTAGEIAAYDLPMQMIVLVIGQQRNGKRISPWVKGFLHPQNKQLRFRKKERSTSEVFNDRWVQIFREDHAEISREKWLDAMLKDDVLPEVCLRIDIPRLDQVG